MWSLSFNAEVKMAAKSDVSNSQRPQRKAAQAARDWFSSGIFDEIDTLGLSDDEEEELDLELIQGSLALGLNSADSDSEDEFVPAPVSRER